MGWGGGCLFGYDCGCGWWQLTYRPPQRNHLQMSPLQLSRQRRVGRCLRGGIGIVGAIGLERESRRRLAVWISFEAFVDACPEPGFVCSRIAPCRFQILVEVGGRAVALFFERFVACRGRRGRLPDAVVHYVCFLA